MATPFEYSQIHPTVLCISRSSDNTNHPKYSLSLFPPIFSHLRSRGRCLPEPHAPRSGIKTFEDEISPTLLVSPISLSLSRSTPLEFLRCPVLRVYFLLHSLPFCETPIWNPLMETRKNITLLPSRFLTWIITDGSFIFFFKRAREFGKLIDSSIDNGNNEVNEENFSSPERDEEMGRLNLEGARGKSRWRDTSGRAIFSR